MEKIMFNDKYGLTAAVLEGRKTMTRRIAYTGEVVMPNSGYLTEGKERGTCVLCDGNRIIAKSRYKVGEVVAVAQKYSEIYNHNFAFDFGLDLEPGWKNKMFVSAAECKHRIRITNIRVERLQDISDEDCMKEGIYKKTLCPPGNIEYFYHSEPRSKWDVYPSPREAFAGLIDKVSGKGTWASNPWVFVYEFELVK